MELIQRIIMGGLRLLETLKLIEKRLQWISKLYVEISTPPLARPSFPVQLLLVDPDPR
jgi:hypothetical protein